MYTTERLLFQSSRVRFPGCYVVGHFNQRINTYLCSNLIAPTLPSYRLILPKGVDHVDQMQTILCSLVTNKAVVESEMMES